MVRHIHGLRRSGEAGLIYRGPSGCAIRQHLRGHHNHMKKHHKGGAMEAYTPAVARIEPVVKSMSSKQYIPLKFKL